MGPPDQPHYINAVVAIRTGLSPRELLTRLQAIERAHGRVRDGLRWGPRTLDLDILLYADVQIEESSLRIPHPGIKDRAFVILPLAEIAPDLTLPGATSVAALSAVFREQNTCIATCADTTQI